MAQPSEEKIPVLLFLLEERKVEQIVKVMLNQKVSQNMLEQYRGPSHAPSRLSSVQTSCSSIQDPPPIHPICVGQENTARQPAGSMGARQQRRENLQRELRAGRISDKIRKTFWLEFTEYSLKPNFYENLKEFNLSTDFQSIIEKDIARTHASPEVRANTEEVLRVFGIYNPYLGYCQGMNNVVAFIISRGFSNEQAFFILKRITEELLPLNYYVNMDCVVAYLRILFEIMHFTHPSCLAHMKALMDDLNETHMTALNFIFQYFIHLFNSSRFSEELVATIWDFFFLEGVPVFFKAGLALFDALHARILSCHSYEQFDELLKTFTLSPAESDSIVQKMKTAFMDDQILHLLTEKLVEIAQEDRKREREEFLRKNQQHMSRGPVLFRDKCDSRWNYCLQMRENNRFHNFVYENFVFKSLNNVNLIENYMDSLCEQECVENTLHLGDVSDGILMGRMPHVCRPASDLVTEDSQQSHQLESIKYCKPLLPQENPEELRTNFLLSMKINQLFKTVSGEESNGRSIISIDVSSSSEEDERVRFSTVLEEDEMEYEWGKCR